MGSWICKLYETSLKGAYVLEAHFVSLTYSPVYESSLSMKKAIERRLFPL